MDIHEVLSAPRFPWQRAHVERLIGSFRQECLDHVIVFNGECLRRTLQSYFRYYHNARLHLSLEKDSPNPRSVQAVGEIDAIPQVAACTISTNVTPPETGTLLMVKRPARICALDHVTNDFKHPRHNFNEC